MTVDKPAKTRPPTTTDGPLVAEFIETWLVHSEGDFYGEPFRLTGSQRIFLDAVYETDRQGRRKIRTVLKGLPKGAGKSELAAAIALCELCGPTAPAAPIIPVAAASYEQADLVFGAARNMAAEGPLAEYVEVFDKQILVRGGPGRMYRVAAVAGTNDGQRTTFVVGDELHEWTGNKARVWQILTQGLAKRQDSWALGITTAGHNLESLLGNLYRYGKRVAAGEIHDSAFLFDWVEIDPQAWDLDDKKQRTQAVRELYGDLLSFANLDQIVAEYHKRGRNQWLRYFGNAWTSTAEQWLPAGSWDELEQRDPPPDGTEVVLAFDGSYNGDSTALVGCTIDDPAVFVVGHWEKPEWEDDWYVPREEVDATVTAAFERWQVVEMACDPFGWHREIDDWISRWGEQVVIHYPSNRLAIIGPACSKFYTAVTSGQLTHDHHVGLARHLENAVVKERGDIAYITKDQRNSPRKIDLAVGAVIAYDRATWRRENVGPGELKVWFG